MKLAATLGIISVLLCAACKAPPEGMIKIPAGTFVMGTNQTDRAGRAEDLGLVVPWYENERPERSVHTDAYFIDQTEVTNAAYALFVQATGRRPPDHWKRKKTPPEGLAQHPVTHVTWHDAADYCIWNGGKSLPTEIQWEKAARGNAGRVYPWGDVFDQEVTNVARANTAPVGSFPKGNSQYGVQDMIGNVWEWTGDWYQAYPGSEATDRKFGERFRVLRGNSWASIGHYPNREEFMEIVANNSRASFRLYLNPDGRLNDVGFRCAKTP